MNPSDPVLLHGDIAPSTVVPLHAHADRETFYILSGVLEGYVGGQWREFRAGEAMDVPSHAPHAFRNRSDRPVRTLIATTETMGRFFTDAGRPLGGLVPGRPTPEDLHRFAAVADQYGYWLGNYLENAGIGIDLR